MDLALVGTIYLIHFEKSFAGRAHYIGWARPVPIPILSAKNDGSVERRRGFQSRIRKHRQSEGAQILSVLNRAKIGWNVVMIWTKKTVSDERRMKNWKKSKQLCPICSPNAPRWHGGLPVTV